MPRNCGPLYSTLLIAKTGETKIQMTRPSKIWPWQTDLRNMNLCEMNQLAPNKLRAAKPIISCEIHKRPSISSRRLSPQLVGI